MSDTTFSSTSNPIVLLSWAFTTLVSGFFLFVVIFAAVGLGFQFSYNGRIYPGISVAGVNLSRLTPEEATARIIQTVTYPQAGRIAFQESGTVWVASPIELGLFLNAPDSVRAAYDLGRSGSPGRRIVNQFEIWFYGKDLPPLLIYDERVAQTYLNNLANTIDRPTIEASIELNGAEVVVHSGQVGRVTNVGATLDTLGPQLQTLTDGLIPVVVDETPPIILDASEQAETAKQILSESLTLAIPNPEEGDLGPWILEPETLAGILSIEQVPDPGEREQYQIGLNSSQLGAFLNDISPSLEIGSITARFTFNDESRVLELLQPSVTGRTLLVDETVETINQKLAEGLHHVELVFDYQQPAVTSESTAEELGITELVSSQTSYFHGSSSPRIHNIDTSASQFHGILVAPGDTFSMVDVLGDVSLDTGYAEALIIFGDRTIKGVGGGVCQVSTTLFRTSFFGGYQVDQRYSHAYRVYYYELTASGSVNTNLGGLDATVYAPLIDYKFTNDSPHWLLMETYTNAAGRSLTWKFYSTSDGRAVEWSTTGLKNQVEPPDPHYEENPELAKGEVEQVDWAVEGADVTVTRTVIRDGEVLHDDVFTTHYRPWRAVYEYGPGTKNMPPKDNDNG